MASFRVFSLGIGSSTGELQVVNLLSVATLVWYCFAKRKDLFAYLHLWKDHKCKGVYGIGYKYLYWKQVFVITNTSMGPCRIRIIVIDKHKSNSLRSSAGVENISEGALLSFPVKGGLIMPPG